MECLWPLAKNQTLQQDHVPGISPHQDYVPALLNTHNTIVKQLMSQSGGVTPLFSMSLLSICPTDNCSLMFLHSLFLWRCLHAYRVDKHNYCQQEYLNRCRGGGWLAYRYIWLLVYFKYYIKPFLQSKSRLPFGQTL